MKLVKNKSLVVIIVIISFLGFIVICEEILYYIYHKAENSYNGLKITLVRMGRSREFIVNLTNMNIYPIKVILCENCLWQKLEINSLLPIFIDFRPVYELPLEPFLSCYGILKPNQTKTIHIKIDDIYYPGIYKVYLNYPGHGEYFLFKNEKYIRVHLLEDSAGKVWKGNLRVGPVIIH